MPYLTVSTKSIISSLTYIGTNFIITKDCDRMMITILVVLRRNLCGCIEVKGTKVAFRIKVLGKYTVRYFIIIKQ